MLRERFKYPMNMILSILGMLGFIGLWWAITASGMVTETIIPSPMSVLIALKELHLEDALVRNSLYSIKLNLLGYLQAIVISISTWNYYRFEQTF